MLNKEIKKKSIKKKSPGSIKVNLTNLNNKTKTTL